MKNKELQSIIKSCDQLLLDDEAGYIDTDTIDAMYESLKTRGVDVIDKIDGDELPYYRIAAKLLRKIADRADETADAVDTN